MNVSVLARQLHLGRLAYRCYHAPKGWIRDLWLDGGPIERRRTEAGRLAMEVAAAGLPVPPASPVGAGPLTVHLLTGQRFWFQTAFCLWSLAQVARRPLAPVILDDSTLSATQAASLLRLFPQARVVGIQEIDARLDAVLPESRFPSLRRRRAEFPLLRKLTDVHAGLTGWKLFLDSDLLFFRRPDLLLQWHDAPDQPLHAADLANAYGYPLSMLAELAGRAVPERVNTGLLGLRSDEVDWEFLEYSCKALLERGGTQYYQEQALVALLLAGRDCLIPPITDYVLLPRPPEAVRCRAVMHHYVAHSKRWYFQSSWRHVLSLRLAEQPVVDSTP